jgi:alpha-L-arabinofuranosidase
VSLTLTEGNTPVTAAMELVAPGSLSARNTMERPQAVRAEPGDVRIEGDTMHLTLPPLSAAVVTIRL